MSSSLSEKTLRVLVAITLAIIARNVFQMFDWRGLLGKNRAKAGLTKRTNEAGERVKSQHLLDRIQAARRPFREAVERLGPEGLERRTSAGWTVKEMVAHVAFWDECALPVVGGMFRGDQHWLAVGRQTLDKWYGGDDLGIGPADPWPKADVHNAREAAWARGKSANEVLARWDSAHERVLALVGTLAEAEAQDERFVAYFEEKCRHHAEHLAELEGAIETWPR